MLEELLAADDWAAEFDKLKVKQLDGLTVALQHAYPRGPVLSKDAKKALVRPWVEAHIDEQSSD